MKKWTFFCFIVCLLLAPLRINGANIPEYELEGAGTATQGNYLVKVTVITKNKKITDNEIARAAVHGVLFRGFSDTKSRISQKPLAGSLANEAQHADFYADFFKKDGPAASFASIVSGSRSVIKSGKFYRITETVLVRKEELHHYLEEAGVIKGFNSIF